jgi:hypothetical protein
METMRSAYAVSAECHRSALSNRAEDAPMLPGHPGAVRLQKPIAVLTHDLTAAGPGPRYRNCPGCFFNRDAD